MVKMIKKTSLTLITALCILLLNTACQNTVLPALDGRITHYVRIHPEPENGKLALSTEQAAEGVWITVYANPDPGFILQEIILQPANGNASTVMTTGPRYNFSVTSNYSVTAVFTPKPAGSYTVTIDPSVSDGLIYAEPQNAEPGRTVRITVVPDAGFDLEDGSLTIDGEPVTAEGEPVTKPPYFFTLGEKDIVINARFKKLDAVGLIGSARKYLDAGQYDLAASLYEQAYQEDKTDPETILYSTLAKLGGLLIDNNVRSLLGSGSLYMAVVPSTLDDWICDKDWTGGEGSRWYTTYAKTEWTPDDAVLPKIYSRFSGFVTPFGDFEIAQRPGLGHLDPDARLNPSDPDSPIRSTVPTREKFMNLIFWGLISSYRNGFNPFIERVNLYAFGNKFEEAASRAATLPENARVLLNPRLKERFGLEEIYGEGDVYVGKVELDYIFGILRAVKAAFIYLSVYDWTIDLRPWLKDEIRPGDGLDQILNGIFKLAQNYDTHKNYWKSPSMIAPILPLKNNFLAVKNPGAINISRTELSKALDMVNASLEYWYDTAAPETSGKFTEDAKASRRWIKGGFSSAKTALDSGGVFYFPKRLSKSELEGREWPGAETADYGLSIGKFFSAGTFTLTNLFTTEPGDRVPSLFKIEWYEDRTNQYLPVFTGNYSLVTEAIPQNYPVESPEAGNGSSAPYGIFSFEVNTKNLKEVFPKGFDEFGDKALFYKVFPTIQLWPWEVTYFKSTMASAAALYEYYHRTTVSY
jgi:hypothetical protein